MKSSIQIIWWSSQLPKLIYFFSKDFSHLEKVTRQQTKYCKRINRSLCMFGCWFTSLQICWRFGNEIFYDKHGLLSKCRRFVLYVNAKKQGFVIRKIFWDILVKISKKGSISNSWDRSRFDHQQFFRKESINFFAQNRTIWTHAKISWSTKVNRCEQYQSGMYKRKWASFAHCGFFVESIKEPDEVEKFIKLPTCPKPKVSSFLICFLSEFQTFKNVIVHEEKTSEITRERAGLKVNDVFF